jgi:hypothetical protein
MKVSFLPGVAQFPFSLGLGVCVWRNHESSVGNYLCCGKYVAIVKVFTLNQRFYRDFLKNGNQQGFFWWDNNHTEIE